MTDLLEKVFTGLHRARLAAAKRGKRRDAETKEKISKAMKGKSNFAGKRHTETSKLKIKDKRGHDDRIDGRKWETDKDSGKEYRKYTLGNPDEYRWGRKKSSKKHLKNFKEWRQL